jgi:ATP-dependent helicase/nuclease subunit A
MADARATALAAAGDEYRRLLYVAMTRAADRLVVCGAIGAQRKPEGCWYDLVGDALTEHCSKEPADDGDGEVWRYRKAAPAGDAAGPAAPPTADRASAEAPGWLWKPAEREAHPLVPVTPSSAYDETVLVRAATGVDRRLALKRGEAMHRLLQSLPALAPDARAEAARRHLARPGSEFSADEQAEMVAQVGLILDDPRFAALFAPGSRAEVPIVGRIERGGDTIAVSGQIDRLAVTADSVLIADYKTNRPAPARLADVPPAYVAQLALYRAVLARLFPGKTIRAALVWTEVPDLMEIPGPALDDALARVKPP